MRLLEVRELLRATLPQLTLKVTKLDKDSAKVEGVLGIVDAARKLAQTGLLQESCEDILQNEYFFIAEADSMIVDRMRAMGFEEYFTRLHDRAHLLLAILDESVPQPTEDTISLRLPDSVGLGEASAALAALDQILSELVTDSGGATPPRVDAFDRGGLWIDVRVGSTAMVDRLAGMTVLLRDSLKRSKLADSSQRDQDRSAIAEWLTTLETSEVTPDVLDRFEKAMTGLRSLLSEGIQIHPAAADDVAPSVTFADAEELSELIGTPKAHGETPLATS